jgi:hypothetical protein
MVGVLSPLYRRSPVEGRRFVAGYVVGVLAAATTLSVLAYVAGAGMEQVVPDRARQVLLAAVLAGLGLLDLAGRTPFLMRQVPQRYAMGMSAGWRGLAWGADLALLVTTQKTTSLPWAALAVVVLVAPGSAAVLVPAMLLAYLVQLVLGTWADHVPGAAFLGAERRLVRWLRVTTGVVLLCLALLQIA